MFSVIHDFKMKLLGLDGSSAHKGFQIYEKDELGKKVDLMSMKYQKKDKL